MEAFKLENVGSKIKKLRKDNKDTLKTLARKIDYDWSNLSKVERGDYGVSVEILNKIAKVYSINPSYFFGDNLTKTEDKMKPTDRLIIDGVEVSSEEIIQAIKMIRLVRSNMK